jgi:hypothetical protein
MPDVGKTASFAVTISALGPSLFTALESTSAFGALMATDDGHGNYTALWATGRAVPQWVGKTAALDV